MHDSMLHQTNDEEVQAQPSWLWADDLQVKGPPPAQSILRPFPGIDVTFHGPNPKPNWWWRMWQYLLLGWVWEDSDVPPV